MQPGTNPEIKWKPSQRLTRKENEFVRQVVQNPKQSYPESAMQAYNAKNRAIAGNIATQLRNKPHIIAELARYSSTAESNLVKLANATTEFALEGGKEGAAYAAVAERTNNAILDRLHGKATIHTETATVAVHLNIDLSSAS